MDVYATEEEQIEALKKWWKENGMAIVVGLVLGLGGIFGWRTWQTHVTAKAEQASIGFQQMVSDIVSDKPEAAPQAGEKLLAEYSDTAYAAFAALTMAKLAADNSENDKARAYLQWVLDNRSGSEFEATARIRLAQLSLSEGDPETALMMMNEIDESLVMPSALELKGDIFVAQSKFADAANAYRQALISIPAGSMETTLLQMKLDDLGASSSAAPL